MSIFLFELVLELHTKLNGLFKIMNAAIGIITNKFKSIDIERAEHMKAFIN